MNLESAVCRPAGHKRLYVRCYKGPQAIPKIPSYKAGGATTTVVRYINYQLYTVHITEFAVAFLTVYTVLPLGLSEDMLLRNDILI